MIEPTQEPTCKLDTWGTHYREPSHLNFIGKFTVYAHDDSVSENAIRTWGTRLAEYSQGTTYFLHQDHLGSTRLVTGYPSPSIVECDDYYPFGEANACGVTTATTLKFTGLERDPETNLDHTEFRRYSSTLGHWMTPDPAGLAAVAPRNPQSWNRYGYVLNSPLASSILTVCVISLPALTHAWM